MNVQEIPVEQLESNPFQYRTHFPEAEMAELVASVAEVGVLQPIQVRPVQGKSTLIRRTPVRQSGERIQLSCKKLSL